MNPYHLVGLIVGVGGAAVCLVGWLGATGRIGRRRKPSPPACLCHQRRIFCTTCGCLVDASHDLQHRGDCNA